MKNLTFLATVTALGLTISNFLFELFFSHQGLIVAFERSYFQTLAIVLLVVFAKYFENKL